MHDDDPDISFHRPRAIPRVHPRHHCDSAGGSSDFVDTSGAPPSCPTTSSVSTISNRKEQTTYAPLPPDLFDHKPLLLNLGGYHKHNGWINVNIQPSSFGAGYVAEVLRNIGDLHGIPDESVDALYCSHALEHMKIGQLEDTLDEWARVLKPGGPLFVSVPDLKVMARYVYLLVFTPYLFMLYHVKIH